MQPPELTLISDYLSHYARRQPEVEALVHDELRLTYQEAAALVDRCARALLANGLKRGDRVVLLGRPRPEYFIVFLATASLGALWLGLDPKYRPSELAHRVGDSRPRALFGMLGPEDRDQATKLRALAAEVSSVEFVVTRAGIHGFASSFEEFLADGERVSSKELRRARACVEARDPAAIIYTSGSTGEPKGAMLSHRGLVRCSLIQADHWYERRPRFVCDLPINHVGCLGDICCSTLVAGGTIFFMEKFDPAAALKLVERERITVWGGVPTMFLIAVETQEFETCDLSSLRRIVWGGAAAPKSLLQRLQRTGATLSTSYGLTESTGSITYTRDDADLDTLAETVGQPDPRYEVRIAGPDGQSCQVGQEGEIQVRGDFITVGYFNRPDATAAAIDADGWLHTGDIAVRMQDGNIRLVGRMKEMYKSGGFNIYPREIELALEQHPSVRLAALVGVPDPLYGEVGHAFVAVESGNAITEDELRAFCRERLANYKVPKRFFIESALPTLPVGKVDKIALRKLAIGRLESGA